MTSNGGYFQVKGSDIPSSLFFFFLGGWGRRDLIVVLFNFWKEEAEKRMLVDWCHICACNVGCILAWKNYITHDVMIPVQLRSSEILYFICYLKNRMSLDTV